ncbi:unnamed protein product [Ilex paraguariensis]|uniref:C3H1-type domain-containing protein n=1 Tax=Ilex paraguariensis TaxID=185542 RepID=A0ABC8QUW9_9AQUA
MMIGERNHSPVVHVPTWTSNDDPTASLFYGSPNGNANFNNADDFYTLLSADSLTALQRYLQSYTDDSDIDLTDDGFAYDLDLPVDAYTCDNFRMYEFKVRKCARARSHDWTECPFAHPGEKARRRDPRKCNYSGTACPDFRKGVCKKGDACEFAHGVFECWLHPSRYRTQPCKDGQHCRRRVCFFAHSPDQLRVLSPRSDSYDGSPHRFALEGSCAKGLTFMSSSDSVSPPTESPPMSPMGTSSLSRSLGSNSINEMVTSLRQLQLNKVKSIPSSWTLQMGSAMGSPRVPMNRPGFCSLPSTPTRALTRIGMGQFDLLEMGGREGEPLMERVESGRDVRTKMFEKLSKENPLGRVDLNNPPDSPNPDVGWVSELVK